MVTVLFSAAYRPNPGLLEFWNRKSGCDSRRLPEKGTARN